MIYDIKGDTNHHGTTAEVHIETPADEFYDRRKMNVYIHRFADVDPDVEDEEESPHFWLFGVEWNLVIKWVGNGDIHIHLHHRSNIPSKRAAAYHVGVVARGFKKLIHIGSMVYRIYDSNLSHLVGTIKVDKAMNILMGGALLLEVDVKKPSTYEPPAFIPCNPSACKTIQDMFMDDETSDVVFEVGGKQKTDESGTKNIKTESKTFYAHYVMLKKCAPVLADMRKSGSPIDPIQLPDVSPEIFNYLLEYIYGHESADFFETDIVQVKEVLEAADKYGVAYLKLKAEACYVSSIELTFDNVMEHLHYADSMNCALLKEIVMDFIANRREVIIKRKILKDIPGDLINDVLAATIRVEYARVGDVVDLSAMSINEIRRRAHKKGLVVDGSREMLISSLERLESNLTNS